MNYTRYRKYPRVYRKNAAEEEELSIELNMTTAIGILAATLINGVAIGYFIKKRLG